MDILEVKTVLCKASGLGPSLHEMVIRISRACRVDEGGPSERVPLICTRYIGVEEQEAEAQLTLYSYNPSESAMANATTKAKQL